jgi:hypothetical protein
MAKGRGAGPEALPAARAAPRRSREEREWRKDCRIDWLYALVMNPKTPDGLKIYAASKALDLIDGPPKPRPPTMMARPPVIVREEEFEDEAPLRSMTGG